MFCDNCGSEIKEGTKFCSHCGAPVKMANAAAAPQPPAVNAPDPYLDSTGTDSVFNGYSGGGTGGGYKPAGRLQSLIAQLASSPLFLVTIIFLTAALVLQLLSAVTAVSFGGYSLLSLIEIALGEAGYSLQDVGGIGAVSTVVNALSAGTIVSTIIVMIPGILTVIGLWLIYGSAKSSGGTSIKPTGFTIVKVIILIYFWIMIVVGAISIIAFIFAAIYAADYSNAGLIAMIVALALVAGVVAVVCLFYSKTAKMLTSAREAGQGATNRLMVSTYVQVLTWIAAIVVAISAVANLGMSGLFSSTISITLSGAGVSNVPTSFVFPFYHVQEICTAVASILFAVIIGKAKALEY